MRGEYLPADHRHRSKREAAQKPGAGAAHQCREQHGEGEEPMTERGMTRREFLAGSAGAAGLAALGVGEAWSAPPPPAAPVAIARCGSYEPAQLQKQLATLFDQIGGIRRLVRGKTVAVK